MSIEIFGVIKKMSDLIVDVQVSKLLLWGLN